MCWFFRGLGVVVVVVLRIGGFGLCDCCGFLLTWLC